EQDGVERAAGPAGGVRFDGFAIELQTREILLEALEPGSRTIDGNHFRAARDQLRGLAAGRGAEIGDALAFDVAEKLRRQRGGRILYPPCAFFVAGERGDGPGIYKADGVCRQQMAVEFSGPVRCFLFHREIERRLDFVRAGNRKRGFTSVSVAPAL